MADRRPATLLELLKGQLLLLVIVAGLVGAWLLPAVGRVLAEAGLVPAAIAAVFFCQGYALNLGRLTDARASTRLLVWGATTSLVLGPALGWAAVELVGWSGDLRVGFVIICCMAPTLVSGIVIAVRAGGERESATLLTIALNLMAVLSVPVTLGWLLGESVSLNRLALLLRLLALVVLPAAFGQLLRRRKALPADSSLWSLVHTLPVLLLGLILFAALSQQAGAVPIQAGPELLGTAGVSLAVHYTLAAVGWWGGRWLLGASAARATSLAIVCSQKTLPIAIAVWSAELADAYPLALLPAVVFHFCQITGDGLLAAPWARWRWGSDGTPTA